MQYILDLMLLVLPLFCLCDFDNDTCYSNKDELDKLTRLLCEAGKVYRGEQPPSQELLNWWTKHQESDRQKGR